MMTSRKQNHEAVAGRGLLPEVNGLAVSVVPGLPPEIDDVAASSDPSRHFLTSAWFDAASVAYATGPVTTLIGRRADGQAVIALPLSAAGPRMLGARSVPGSYWPFRSFPVAADVTEAELAGFLRARTVRGVLGHAWRLGPVYAIDPAASLLRAAASHSGWNVITRYIGTNFVLDVAALRSEGEWPRGSTLKKNRYFEKHLSALGELQWRFVRGTEWSPALIDLLATIEANSWVGNKTDRSTAKFLAPSHRRFWTAAVHNPEFAGRVSAALLLIAGKPVAFSLDLESGPTKYVIANSYDASFAKHSPGRVLSYRNIHAALERGIRYVDWGAGDSGYKQATGAAAGSEIVDHIFVRGRFLGRLIALMAAPLWKRTGN